MKLLHISDAHLTTPPQWRTLFGRSHYGKRFLGYASWWRRRRHQMRRPWLDDLVAAIDREAPDQILISGDLTQIGTEEELSQARAWLDSLGEPDRITLVPGNHDLYSNDSRAAVSRLLGDYLHRGDGDFPAIRRMDGLTVFGASSAVPTPPLSARGALGRDQRLRLDAALAAATDQLSVLMLHHPPLPGMTRLRKSLRDASDLARIIDSRRVDLVLHGHEHRNLSATRGTCRIYCTAPASSERASYRVFEFQPIETSAGTAGDWQVSARLMQRDDGTVEEVARETWRISARA